MTETTKKRTRVNIINNVSWAMCAALPNVLWTVPTDPLAVQHPGLTDEMRVILFNAAHANPAWTFTVAGVNMGERSRFTCKCKDEFLAVVKNEYSKRTGDYIPHLHADRLPYARGRSNVFSHKEPAAILRKLREVVYPKTLEEKVGNDVTNIVQRAYGVQTNCARAAEEARKRMHTAAIEFALSPMHKEMFMAYEASVGVSKNRNTVEDIEAMRVEVANADLALKMRTKAGDEFPIAIRRKEGWYIKHNNAVAFYEDDALPEAYANVHVMKLVPDERVLEGVGMRINESSYIVVTAIAA